MFLKSSARSRFWALPIEAYCIKAASQCSLAFYRNYQLLNSRVDGFERRLEITPRNRPNSQISQAPWQSQSAWPCCLNKRWRKTKHCFAFSTPKRQIVQISLCSFRPNDTYTYLYSILKMSLSFCLCHSAFCFLFQICVVWQHANCTNRAPSRQLDLPGPAKIPCTLAGPSFRCATRASGNGAPRILSEKSLFFGGRMI